MCTRLLVAWGLSWRGCCYPFCGEVPEEVFREAESDTSAGERWNKRTAVWCVCDQALLTFMLGATDRPGSEL